MRRPLVTAVAVAILSSASQAAAQRTVTLIVHSSPERAAISQDGRTVGIAPASIKYRTTKEFRAGKACLIIPIVTARWTSGVIRAEGATICPVSGKRLSKFELRLDRPELPGRELDDAAVEQAERAMQERAAARRAKWQAVANALQAFADGYSAASTGSRATADSMAATRSAKLMLFGGVNHKTFLGCLTCSEYDVDSVFNTFGMYGSRFSVTSIFNNFSEYGSKYSSYSPCNEVALDPPVIVDGAGNFYGRLTVSTVHPQRTSNREWQAWIAGVCAG